MNEITKLEATTKVRMLMSHRTHDVLASDIGISKPTLYVRLVKHNWKKGEMALIASMKG